MNFNFDALRAVMPRAPKEWLSALVGMRKKWRIDNLWRLSAFAGQLAHESDQFLRLEENLNYRAERLMAVWPKRFPTFESTKGFARNPEALANKVYAGRMGNGGPLSGDGWRFRGRGPIQLTGRDNYAAAGSGIGLGLLQTPQRVLQPDIGVDVAAWYWDSHGLNELADAEDWRGITKRINGGVIGYLDADGLLDAVADCRLEWILKAREALK